MSISDIKDMFRMSGVFGIRSIIGAGVLFFYIEVILPSYFSEKVKNLATNEYIGEITSEVEQVKSGCVQMLEEVRSNRPTEASFN